MDTLISQHPEDRHRQNTKERVMTRGAAAAMKNDQITKQKLGTPATKSEVVKKTVAFVEPEEEEPQTSDKLRDNLKGKPLPYVDVPPIKASLRAPVNDQPKGDQFAKLGPAYKSRAPVEIGVDIEKLVESVLDLEISVPLRSLAGVSGAIQKEIRKQVTKTRLPVEGGEGNISSLLAGTRPMVRIEPAPISMFTFVTEVTDDITEGYMVANDPVLQYLAEHKDIEPSELIVATESESLRSIYMTINRVGQEECLLDGGSMIVSMARDCAVQMGLTWDPSICVNMESVSNHLERTLGLARNVLFAIAGLKIFLQVHILENPPYRVLLGRPFETFTSCISKTRPDGSSELVITDPNSKTVAIVPTYKRGCGPEELQKQRYQGF